MKLNITIDGKTYEVDVEVAEADHAGLPPAYPIGSARLAGSVVGTPAPAVAPSAAPVEDEAKVCRSPVSGIIVKLIAQLGQSLQVGDSLMVLEAMKMENEIQAPADGTVTAILVNKGDSVLEGAEIVKIA